MHRCASLLCLVFTVACTGASRAAGWELRRDDARPERPPVREGVVTLDAGDPEAPFPRYLNELGVKAIRIRFTGAQPGPKTVSFVWQGGSQGPDRFAVVLDGKVAGMSRLLDTARRPYAWHLDEVAITVGPGKDHVLEIRSLPEYQSAVEFAAIRLSDPKAQPYQPLCYESIGTLERYEAALGAKGCVVSSPHMAVFAPAEHQADARRLSVFLEKSYGEMKALYGIDPVFRFSVEHYPPGHRRGWGGISGQGTIGYTTEALERFARLGATDVRGFAGYTEEMSHGFKAHYRCSGTYEALGVAVQEEVVRRLVSDPVADAFWLPEHRQWDETHRAYLAAGRVNPDPARYPNNVLYTRILNDVFLKLRTEYGPRMWPDFFAEVRRRDYPLHRASKTEYMRVYAAIFTELFKRDMAAELERAGVTLDSDPPWGWQTYEKG